MQAPVLHVCLVMFFFLVNLISLYPSFTVHAVELTLELLCSPSINFGQNKEQGGVCDLDIVIMQLRFSGPRVVESMA